MRLVFVDFRVLLDALRSAGVMRIGHANSDLAVDLLGYGSSAALVAEVAAAPVRRVGEHSVASEPPPVVVEDLAAALRTLEVGYVQEEVI